MLVMLQGYMSLTSGQPTFIQRAGAEVQAQIRLSTNSLTPLHELISPKLIRLDAEPR